MIFQKKCFVLKREYNNTNKNNQLNIVITNLLLRIKRFTLALFAFSLFLVIFYEKG